MVKQASIYSGNYQKLRESSENYKFAADRKEVKWLEHAKMVAEAEPDNVS